MIVSSWWRNRVLMLLLWQVTKRIYPANRLNGRMVKEGLYNVQYSESVAIDIRCAHSHIRVPILTQCASLETRE
jgi:hypothetical protein